MTSDTVRALSAAGSSVGMAPTSVPITSMLGGDAANAAEAAAMTRALVVARRIRLHVAAPTP